MLYVYKPADVFVKGVVTGGAQKVQFIALPKDFSSFVLGRII